MQKQLLDILRFIRDFIYRNFKKYDVKLPYIITVIIALLLFVAGTKIFIKLTESLKTDFMGSFDQAVTSEVVSWRQDLLTEYFIAVTNLGDVWGYIIVFSLCTLIFYLVFKSWKFVGQIALVLVLALSSNLLLKRLVNRARPDAEFLVEVQTLSYPSGHAMMAMAFYGFLIYLINSLQIRKFYKFLLSLFLIILILSIGISRIYLGVHYPSDIIGGFLAGFIWVIFCILVFNLVRIFRRDTSV
ncbi:phosphatase PAP2 family protein [Christiangramia sp. SM2212]|uniref:Phosphatase PAP2 family protein n=1 Tax=Christiangramia sediminicola TaxID=3073267 RepID=A0ABU1EL31_9FLAO|nr:phosphatase PAP2 family protein [Christiangramia sp. SM2212]MDR5589090.1 phosphatase PAP2 family protein [Christiangramia sp. SM2212]